MNNTKSKITTRAQTLKCKDETINKLEEKVLKLEDSVNFYERLICEYRLRLKEKDNLINVLKNEQEEFSQDFEKMCKENSILKRELATKDLENTDLQNSIINLNDVNQTLNEENEEININNNSIIVPLKNQLIEMQKENTHLNNKITEIITQYPTWDKQKSSTVTLSLHKSLKNLKYIRNRKLSKKIRRQVKNIKKLEMECKKIKYINNRLEKQIKNIKCQESNEKILKMDVSELRKEDNNKHNEIKDGKHLQRKTIIIGDSYIKNLGTMLKDRGLHNICCYIHTNATVEHILYSAKNIINKENSITLAITVKKFNYDEINKYPLMIKDLADAAKNKNIRLLFTNIPYRIETMTNKTNEMIENYNLKLKNIITFSSNLEIINISHIDMNKITNYNYKKLLTYFIEKYMANTSNENNDFNKNFLTNIKIKTIK